MVSPIVPSMKAKSRIVLDSNVFISALRSRRGPSFHLLSLIGQGPFEICVSVPLVLEYEAVAKRERWPNKPSWRSISDILDYLCLVGSKEKIHYLWRPRERDLKDDMVLEVAVAGQCAIIVTYNKRDFIEAFKYGIKIMTPREFLTEIGEIS